MQVRVEDTTGQTCTLDIAPTDTAHDVYVKVASSNVVAGTPELFYTTGGASVRLVDSNTALKETLPAGTHLVATAQWTYPASYAAFADLLSLSPGGVRCASAHSLSPQEVRITDLATGTFSVVPGKVCVRAMVLTKRHLVYASGSTVRLLEGSSLSVCHELVCDSAVHAIAGSADGQHIVVGCAAGLYVFSTETGECVRRRSGGIFLSSLSPCSRWIASRSGLYAFATLAPLHRFDVNGSLDCAPAFSPCSTLVALPSEQTHTIWIFATEDGTCIHTLTCAHDRYLTSLQFGSSGELFSSSLDKRIMKWDMSDGSGVCILEHASAVYACRVAYGAGGFVFTDLRGMHTHTLLGGARPATPEGMGPASASASAVAPQPQKKMRREKQASGGCKCC